MKKLNMILAALLVCGAAGWAAQDTDITQREVRDPRQLETWLEANASDAETRLTAAGATATSAITLTNSSNTGTCSITANADANGDAGDLSKILMGDNAGFAFQTDKDSKGTLATKLTIGESGIVTMKGSATLDNTTSATTLTITEDTVAIVGAATVSSTLGVSGVATAAGLSTTGAVTIAEGALQDSRVVSADIKDGTIADADVSASAAIAHSKLATDGILDAVAAAASRTEAASALVVTTITFTNVSMVATDTSDEGESVKIADFDAGAFTVLAAILNATCTISAGATGAHYVAMGTVAAADDSDLTSTEADVIPKTTLSASGAKAADAVLASTIIFDGTATAKDLYFNWAIDDDNMNANATNVVTGTLTIISTKAVDNQ